jgi:CubicO group peptidase (beta-lactamase class C family)
VRYLEININKKLILGIIIVAAIATTGIISAFIILQPQTQENLDSRIKNLLAQGEIPSLAAGIVINDTLVWSNGYGDQPDGLDTIYMIASVTKVFTATAIMQLYENNTLELDTDIDNYIPFSVRNPNSPSTPITIRDILSHSSGISKVDTPLWDYDADFINWANNNIGWNLTAWDPRPTLGEFLNGTLNPGGSYYKPDVWRNFQSGNQWQYSNLGFLLLTYVVEQLTNRSYVEYLQEQILDPLDMTSTGFYYTNFQSRSAIPYEQGDTGLIEGPIYNNYNFGGGGLRSSVPDLAKFLLVHMNGGSYNNKQILLPQTVDMMQTAQFSMFGNELGGFQYEGYGLGWPLFLENKIGHGGACPGYLAQISFKKVNNGKYGIVFMLNKGASLASDDFLVNSFFPSMVNLLFEEATRLYSQ